MAPEPKGNSIKLFPGAAETIPCHAGAPFPDLPSSFLLAAPTASGKTMILLNLLLRYYKDQFARIWFFSPSIKLDPQYAPLRKYLERMSDQKKEPLMFEELDQTALGKILDEQRQIVEECRKRKIKAPQVCVVLDDLADRGDILCKRQGAGSGGSWLTTLAVRGRHLNVTWMISTQCLNLIGTIIRKNVRCMAIWRLRNHKEIEVMCEELSGIYSKETIMQMYLEATAEPYSFLFVRLDGKTRQEMFFKRFEQRLIPSDKESDERSVGNGGSDDEQVRKSRPQAGAKVGPAKHGSGPK
jgi:Poxvirus A32 protein